MGAPCGEAGGVNAPGHTRPNRVWPCQRSGFGSGIAIPGTGPKRPYLAPKRPPAAQASGIAALTQGERVTSRCRAGQTRQLRPPLSLVVVAAVFFTLARKGRTRRRVTASLNVQLEDDVLAATLMIGGILARVF